MKTINFYRLLSVTLWLILFSSTCISSCKKDPVDKPGPVVVKGYLSFDLSSAHDLQVSGVGLYQYEILTTGPDPYVLLKPLTSKNADAKLVFTFEYQSTATINNLQLFFAPPVTEERSVKSDELPASVNWKVFSIDLGDQIEELGWGNTENYLRLDFGNNSGVTIQIRNMEFRERNGSEQALADARAEERENNRILEEKLKNYLASDFNASITRVAVLASKITVSGNCPDPGNRLLCEVTPYRNLVQITNFEDGVSIDNQNFSIEMDRYAEKEGFNY
ncbi:MAG: hypothetical protein ACP5D9_04065, partial [Mariniphaga sp.]